MRLVIQRVAQASVTGGGRTDAIGRGLLVLVGVEDGDTRDDAQFVIGKMLKLKLFPSPPAPPTEGAQERQNEGSIGESANGGSRWAQSVVEAGFEVLLVSQFTLHAVFKGARPSFHRAMAPSSSKEMFERLVEDTRAQLGDPARVKCCVFGSYMNVALVNDGPVTLIVDSRNPKGG
mmetsp:Transcript_8108/g.21451  ORF Transcript_8108/g.21451 Transcript_8108/m.21451 type:complete len:176 (-) Transcript_8108:943-1470(-)